MTMQTGSIPCASSAIFRTANRPVRDPGKAKRRDGHECKALGYCILSRWQARQTAARKSC
jgi:hypothetical protein